MRYDESKCSPRSCWRCCGGVRHMEIDERLYRGARDLRGEVARAPPPPRRTRARRAARRPARPRGAPTAGQPSAMLEAAAARSARRRAIRGAFRVNEVDDYWYVPHERARYLYRLLRRVAEKDLGRWPLGRSSHPTSSPSDATVSWTSDPAYDPRRPRRGGGKSGRCRAAGGRAGHPSAARRARRPARRASTACSAHTAQRNVPRTRSLHGSGGRAGCASRSSWSLHRGPAAEPWPRRRTEEDSYGIG